MPDESGDYGSAGEQCLINPAPSTKGGVNHLPALSRGNYMGEERDSCDKKTEETMKLFLLFCV